ncbi:MAG TPA: hypothetical protein VK467_04535 [Gemmatimonadales bacterium]|nr:hypothetical protein [Gemmatimonadales bacterium]
MSPIFAVVEWDATAVVLVIAAVGAMAVQIISAWRTGAKVTEVHDKVAVIEQHTNGMNAALQNTKDELAEELKLLKAANLAALVEQRDRAQMKVAEQNTDLLRRADAATPSHDKEKP